MESELRERLEAAGLASVTSIASDGYPSTGYRTNKEAAEVAESIVANWLSDLAAVQWKRAETSDWAPSRQMSLIRAMYLTDLADKVTGKYFDELAAALGIQPATNPGSGEQ